MDKFNPQPEPPGNWWNIFGWISYVFQMIFWFIGSFFERDLQ